MCVVLTILFMAAPAIVQSQDKATIQIFQNNQSSCGEDVLIVNEHVQVGSQKGVEKKSLFTSGPKNALSLSEPSYNIENNQAPVHQTAIFLHRYSLF